MSDIDLDAAEEVVRRRWLLMRIEDEIRALPADEVVEISPPRPVRRLPGAPAEVLGLMNHRGTIVTVVDLPRLLGHPKLDVDDYRLVFVRWGGQHLVALATHDVLGFDYRIVGDPLEMEGAMEIDALLHDLF